MKALTAILLAVAALGGVFAWRLAAAPPAPARARTEPTPVREPVPIPSAIGARPPPNGRVLARSFDPPVAGVRGPDGARHELTVDAAGHPVYSPGDGRTIALEPRHPAGPFALAVDDSGGVHLAWFDRDDQALRYLRLPAAPGARPRGELLRSLPGPPARLAVRAAARTVSVLYAAPEGNRYAETDLSSAAPVWRHGPFTGWFPER